MTPNLEHPVHTETWYDTQNAINNNGCIMHWDLWLISNFCFSILFIHIWLDVYFSMKSKAWLDDDIAVLSRINP